MTKKEIIKKARKFELPHVTWWTDREAWWQRSRPLTRHQLKLARIERALCLLGEPEDEAGHDVWCTGTYEDLQLEEVVYGYNRKNENERS